jgi:hypothetical protein
LFLDAYLAPLMGGALTEGNRMTFRFFAKRAGVLTAATAALVLAGTSSASAHFCYKTDLNPQAAEGMAGSANWMSFEELATEFLGPLCHHGLVILADAGGVELDTMINTHGTMAAGTLKKEQPGTKSIGYLDFEALDAAIPAAFTACGQVPPGPPA